MLEGLNVKGSGLKESLLTLAASSTEKTKQQSAGELGSTGGERASLGSKYLERNLTSSPTLDDTTTSATVDAMTDESAAAYCGTIRDQMFALMKEVSVNLTDSFSASLQVSVEGAKQANFGAEAAKKSSDDFQAQQAEQEKKAKHMKILNRCMKCLAITILIVSVLTGQPELAPISTLLMSSLSALMIAKPSLISNQLVGPLSKVVANGLHKGLHIPEKWANLLASAIVITAMVVAIAGGGFLADSSLGLGLGEKVTQKVGRQAAKDCLEKGGLDYVKLGLGNAAIGEAQLIGVTHSFVDLLSNAFPNHPLVGQILGVTLTLAAVLAAGAAGGTLVSSSGYFNTATLDGTFAEFSLFNKDYTIKNQDLLKMAIQALRAAQVGAEADQAWTGYQQGIIRLYAAQAQAEMTHARSITQGANGYVQAAGRTTSQISESLKDLSSALEGMTAGGEEFARLNW